MIGEHPKTEAFREYFNWPDSVINVPYDSANIADVLTDLDSQPDRIEAVRKNSIVQSLLRHDWAYRWKAILEIAGLEPQDALAEREERLAKLAQEIKSDSAMPNLSQVRDNEQNTFLKTGT
jgi:hypothetical protein